MRDKILILGCSSSFGSYSTLPDGNEEQTSNYCWYNELDKRFRYMVYSCPGGGMLNYAMLLDNFDGLDEFSAVLIQQTLDPRLYILQEGIYQDEFDEDNIKVHTPVHEDKVYRHHLFGNFLEKDIGKNWPGIDKLDVTKEWQFWFEKLDSSRFVPIVNRAMYHYVDKKLEESGVPSFTFSVAKPKHSTNKIVQNYIKRLDTPNLQDDLWSTPSYKASWPFGHQTIEGNKMIGERVNKALMRELDVSK